MPRSGAAHELAALADALKGRRVLHLGHTDADCDALGSAFALSCLIPGELGFAGGLKAMARDLAAWLGVTPVTAVDPADFEYVIIHDTPNLALLGTPLPGRYALVDHHVPGGHRFSDFRSELADEAEWCWVRPYESTCSVLAALLCELGAELRPEMGVALAAGIITDTAWLRLASAAAMGRLGWVLESAGLTMEDVFSAVDSPGRQAERRGAVLRALRNVWERSADGWCVLAAETDEHEHGFALSAALARLGADVRVVVFPKRGMQMVMLESDGYLVEETGINLGALAEALAAERQGVDHWGTRAFGRVIAPGPAGQLQQRAVNLVAEALSRAHKQKGELA